jgi:signal transduction histidine kinase
MLEGQEEKMQVVVVKDNGIGIDSQQIDQLFNLFDGKGDRKEEGKRKEIGGIGLAICRKIIARHGGRIWVESELDQGSSFFVSLPGRGKAFELPEYETENTRG